MKTLLIALALIAGSAAAAAAQTPIKIVNHATCTVSWLAPTANADGTPLTDLKEYHMRVAKRTDPATPAILPATPSAVILAVSPTPSASTRIVWPCSHLTAGVWDFDVRAADISGNEGGAAQRADGGSGPLPLELRDLVSPGLARDLRDGP